MRKTQPSNKLSLINTFLCWILFKDNDFFSFQRNFSNILNVNQIYDSSYNNKLFKILCKSLIWQK